MTQVKISSCIIIFYVPLKYQSYCELTDTIVILTWFLIFSPAVKRNSRSGVKHHESEKSSEKVWMH